MSYVDDFRKHQISVQAHLKGRQENDPAFTPSFFLPASHWTSSEKDLFFHGLTLYSRFRPDLIAEHIKTKNIFDVCVYLHVLHVATISRGHELGASARETIEPTMEMSERWVEYEEQMAAALTAVDSCCHRVEHSEKQAQGNCSCASAKIHFTSAEPGLTPSNQKAYMGHLDSTRLAVLESIIRESQSDDVDIEKTMLLEHDLESEFQTSPAPNIQPAPLEPPINRLTPLPPLANPDLQEASCNPHEGIVKPMFTNNSHLRRLQKLLYMRRKRAEKVGRRSRKLSKSRPKISHSKRKIELHGGSSILVSEELQPPIDPSESLDESWFEPRNRGGPTKPYRVKKAFRENDIDAHMLSEMGLDIFHLPTLARLMRLFNSLNGPTAPLQTVDISAETINLLVSIAKDFVSEIIRRAIITKELEVRLKRKIKVWKYDRDEITPENVTECLNSMGLGEMNKKKYFETILGRINEEHEHPNLSPLSPTGLNDDVKVPKFRVDSDILESQRTLLPHSFTLPHSMLWCSLPSHRDLFSSDDICDLEFGDGDLDWIMQEEEQLDIEDNLKSKEYEGSLWNQACI